MAGRGRRRGGAGRLDEHALTGVAVACGRLASWAQAAGLAAVGQLAARTADADRRIGLKPDGRPARVSRDAVGQIEMALKLSHYGAEERADLAVTLSWRLPYNCVRWGRHDLPPQAGIAVYERGPDGLLAAARAYDDVEAPVEEP